MEVEPTDFNHEFILACAKAEGAVSVDPREVLATFGLGERAAEAISRRYPVDYILALVLP